MKIVFFSCLLFLFHAVFCLAQDTDTLPDYYNPEKAALYAGSKADNNGTYKLIDPEKTSFGVDAGGSAGVWKGGSMTGTFVAPHLNYRISPRFSAGLGGMLVNSTFTNAGIYQPGEGYIPLNGNLIRNLVFLRGSYAVNNRLSVSGTAFYEVGRFGTKDQNANLSSKGFIIGADYKTGEKSAVSFSIEISDRSSPFLYSPLHSPYQGSSALPDR